jgi:hypothetical protein
MSRHTRTCGRCATKTRAMMYACPWDEKWGNASLCRPCATNTVHERWSRDEHAADIKRLKENEMALIEDAMR